MSCSAGSSFGTNSPALEIVEDPMGVCSIKGDRPRALSDAEQRKDYLHGHNASASMPGGRNEMLMGEAEKSSATTEKMMKKE
ncbi:hypothetical protein C8Q75DRAFT_602412 [Abortiporus biennis]|nr:hypothetical protein C8Q75DRAFT_602412 [Abortiporus biennis]